MAVLKAQGTKDTAMPKVAVYNLEREKTAEIELKEEIFNTPVKRHLLHQVVTSQLSRRRAGSASTKGRSEVKASGSKLWRQKGTGRARVGGGLVTDEERGRRRLWSRPEEVCP